MLNVMGPYARPTEKASQKLSRAMQAPGNQWWIPFPLSDTERADFRSFLTRKGVTFSVTLFGELDADQDLCPYVWAWRFLRGEIQFTALGRAQYAHKAPFAAENLKQS